MRISSFLGKFLLSALTLGSLAACSPNNFSSPSASDRVAGSSDLLPTGDGAPGGNSPTPTPAPSPDASPSPLPADKVAQIIVTLVFNVLGTEITQITQIDLNQTAQTFTAKLIQTDGAGNEQANCQIPGSATDFTTLQTSLQAVQVNSTTGTTALPPGSSRANFQVTFLDGTSATYRLEVNENGIDANIPLANIDELLGFLDTLDASQGTCNLNF